MRKSQKKSLAYFKKYGIKAASTTTNKNMNNKITINDTLNGKGNIIDLWYDWFCRESSLENKGKKLLQKLRAIADSKKFDNDKSYVFFKNNCPCDGSLYDDFRICDIETGDVLYTVIPSCGHKYSKGKAQVWGRENVFAEPIIEGTWREVKSWFLNA